MPFAGLGRVMTKHPIVLIVLASASLALAASCKSGGKESGSAGPADPADKPPNKLQGPVAADMRTVKSDPKMIEEGKTLFATCAGCHGQDGKGVLGTGPALNSKTFLAAASDDYLVRTIEKGRAGTTMVPWGGQLSRDQIYSVVSYIRSWQDVEPAELNEDELAGDEAAGSKLFREICAGCHGRSGAGYMETSNGTGIGRAGFLAQVSNGYLRYIIKNGKSQTKMRPFREGSKVAVANLTDEQIEDVIFYLRRTGW